MRQTVMVALFAAAFVGTEMLIAYVLVQLKVDI